MIIGACQNFQFFRENNWFLKNNRALSKLLYWSYKKNQTIKLNFVLTTQATLTILAVNVNSFKHMLQNKVIS